MLAHHPFRRGWSMRLGPIRLRSAPWYWDILWERLSASSPSQHPLPPMPAHHDHYCEECDGSWMHDGHTCATAWASPCPTHLRGSARKHPHGSGPWLIVVRRERTELCRHLGESFKDQARVTVLLDRRQSERRGQGRTDWRRSRRTVTRAWSLKLSPRCRQSSVRSRRTTMSQGPDPCGCLRALPRRCVGQGDAHAVAQVWPSCIHDPSHSSQ